MSDRVPSYRRHRQSGQAIVTLTDGCGGRRDVLLGEYGTVASRAEYARVIAEWEAAGRRLPSAAGAADITVAELVLAYLQHVEEHYRHADGTPTTEQKDYRQSLRPLKYVYGQTPAKDFGPLALKAVRQLLVDGYDHPKFGPQAPLSRSVVNQRVGRIRRVFKWAVEQELVPPSLFHGLQAVQGLQRGRTKAREPEPVAPVSEAMVNDTLPFLNRYLAALVQVQLLTGARPGEICIMRACDIDMGGKVWLYRPETHKTIHHGHERTIAIGPRAQAVIRPFLRAELAAYLFSPKLVMEELRAAKRLARKRPVAPSEKRRKRVRQPKKAPGEHYTTDSYGRAIAEACEAAFPPPAGMTDPAELEEWRKAHHWHSHQLRHTAGTKLRREFGLDVARAVLGHKSAAITEVYAEVDATKAVDVMERLG
jgi:integrase